ncbi:MAG: hypothetical protein HY337_07795 [Gemmatimonadetes bacterium]|nr:hypothetical protein [Gemmatimonadota bacterium]
MRSAKLVLLTLAWAAPVLGQSHDMQYRTQMTGCTLCAPWVYAEGAALYRSNEGLPAGLSENWTPLVRAVVELGTPIRHVGFFTHLEFAPDDGATPTLTYGAQLWLLPRFKRMNLTGGVGLIHRRNGIGEDRPGAFEARGWAHAGAEYQTPIHEIALYAQAGTAFNGETGLTYQVGIRHPIAPWKAHLF